MSTTKDRPRFLSEERERQTNEQNYETRSGANMSLNEVLLNTPCDVLLDDKQRLGPKLLAQSGGTKYEAIYGFSNKKSYDLFCANSDHPLKPYPLVKGYLKNQIADSGDTVQLVVVDAAGPQETQVHAATMNCVLKAVEQKANQVAFSFRLTLDRESQAYRVDKALSE